MRIKIQFGFKINSILPFERKYVLSSWIYGCIRKANEEYSSKLHFDKDIKQFVFSDLYILRPYSIMKGNGIKALNPKSTILVSSPHHDFISNFVNGLLECTDQENLSLGSTQLHVESVEVLKAPEFDDECDFKSLTPVVASANENGKIRYLKLHEEKFYENLKNNLKKKYMLLYAKEYKKEIEIEPLYEKIKGKVSYLSNIKGGKILGFKIPFKISANSKMLKVAYECGLGEKNSQGFGMLDVYKKTLENLEKPNTSINYK